MDEDGSGAIDVDELSAAFKLLGFNLRKAEILELVNEVDHDGTGELEYNEFLEVMTVTLLKLSEAKHARSTRQSQVPFALMTTAYKRKKLLERITDGTKESLIQIVESAEEEERAKEREKEAAEARAQRHLHAQQQSVLYLRDSKALNLVSSVSMLSPECLAEALGVQELRAAAQVAGRMGSQSGQQQLQLQQQQQQQRSQQQQQQQQQKSKDPLRRQASAPVLPQLARMASRALDNPRNRSQSHQPDQDQQYKLPGLISFRLHGRHGSDDSQGGGGWSSLMSRMGSRLLAGRSLSPRSALPATG